MKTKKLVLVMFIFLLALSLAACNSNATDTSSSKETQDTGKKEEPKKEEPKKEEPKKASINVLTQSIEPKELLKKFHDQYPHITVKWEMVDTANITQVIRTRLAAGGENLDVVTPQRNDYASLVAADAFLDLSDKPFLTNYDPAAVESGKVDGNVYGIPLTQQAYLVWYNKDIFKEYGLTEPTNWEEFLAVSKKLKSNGIAPLVVAGQDEWVVNVFAGLAYSGVLSQEPHWITKAAKGEVKWTDEGSLDALNKIKTLKDEGYILDGSLGTGYDQAYQAFFQGKAAMTVNGAWSIDWIINTPPSFEVGAFVPSGNDPGQDVKVAFIPGNILSVSSASKNQEAALTFVEFLSEPENATLFTDAIKQFSSVQGTSADFHEATKIIRPIFEYEKTQMMHAEVSPTARSVLGPALQKLIGGEATPEQVAKEIQEAQERDIK